MASCLPRHTARGARVAGALVAGALVATCPAVARADGPVNPAVSADRAVPDYDGRGLHRSHGHPLLWIPRVLLSPVYFVSEYVVREPLAVAVPAAEHADVPREIYDFFTFGPKHEAGFLPVGFAEFNFNPSVGVYAFWNDAGFAGDDLHLHLEAWPADWVGGSLVERITFDPAHALQLRVSGSRRPDHVFYGLGPTSLQSSQSRFGQQGLDVGATYEWRFWRSSRVQTSAGVRGAETYDGSYGSDPSLKQEAATGAFAVPAGFGTAYTDVYDRLTAIVDTRAPAGRPGSGLRIELDAEQGSEVQATPASGFLRYGATAAGYVDLNGRSRVLGLSVTTLFVDPLGSRPVPFPELVYLGGDHPMAAYYSGRMVDRSAAAATASYAWPVAPWLDGRLEVATGNVFGTHLGSFDTRLLRLSAALGLSVAGLKDPITGVSDAPIEFLVGVGTETFAQGAAFDSVRVMLGVPRTF